MMRVKHPFTLLELLLCLAILSIVGGVVGWHVKGLLDHHQLHNTAHRLIIQLRELQSLALNYQTELEMELLQTPQGIAYRCRTDEPLKGFNQSLVPLNDRCHMVEKRLLLKVFPSGRIEPAGEIKITQGNAAKKVVIDLSKPLQIKMYETNK